MKKIIIFLFLFLKIFSENKNFVIIIPSFNNKSYYQLNLDSAFGQNYKNYRIIYVDDCSTDETFNLVESYISQLPDEQKNKINLLKNDERVGPLGSIYKAVHLCNPNEIAVCLDGDDYFYDNNVLNYLNEIYQDKNIWATYGSYIKIPGRQIGGACEIPQNVLINNKIREYDFVTTHLKTFYAQLFHKIKLEDLTYQNKFIFMAGDVAFMIPLIEMAGTHAKFISQILYCYNLANPLSESTNRQLQGVFESITRKRQKYQPLEKLDV